VNPSVDAGMSSQFIVAEIFQATHREGAPKFLLSPSDRRARQPLIKI